MEQREEHKKRKADLHVHTKFSDGALTPSQIVDKAKQADVAVIGIVDHDNMNGVPEATSCGKDAGVVIIPGVELSATFNNKEVHILGYFVDNHSKELSEFLSALREERKVRAKHIIDKLHSMNIPLTMESVVEKAGEAAIGRPHIAYAMVEQGLAESYQSVFNKYIGDKCPAYEKRSEVPPSTMTRIISDAGGLSFLAHPAHSLDDSDVAELIKTGIDGIEVIHPSHSPEVVRHYREIVQEYFLLESGGSDFHGGLKNDDQAFGRVTIPVEIVDAMRQRLFSIHQNH